MNGHEGWYQVVFAWRDECDATWIVERLCKQPLRQLLDAATLACTAHLLVQKVECLVWDTKTESEHDLIPTSLFASAELVGQIPKGSPSESRTTVPPPELELRNNVGRHRPVSLTTAQLSLIWHSVAESTTRRRPSQRSQAHERLGRS